MRKKKLLGKIVSLVLAAALTLTSLPTSGMEVYAAEQVQTETETPETEEVTDNAATLEDESAQVKSEDESEDVQSTEEEKASEVESEEKKSSEAESDEEKDSQQVDDKEDVVPAEDENVKSPVVGKGKVTFYYFSPDAETVIVKGSAWGWDDNKYPMQFDDETGYWSITLTAAVGTYEYGFEVNGVWANDPLNPNPNGGNCTFEITEASEEVSPVIEGNTVTFKYEDATGTAESVALAGSMNEWDPTKNLLKKEDETSNVWTLTLEDVKPGRYTYKFVVGANGWTPDPLNSNRDDEDNCIFWVAGLADGKVEVTSDGEAAELPKSLELWTIGEDGTGTSEDKAVTYALSAETAAADYAELITLTAATETESATISLKEGFPEEVKSFTLTATDEDGNTSTVTVDVVAEKYNYTVYYYDKNHTVAEESALWVWETNGAGGVEYPFMGSEELTDGNTWMKAELSLSFVDLSIITKSKGDWSWQSVDYIFENSDKAKDVTLYLVADDTTVYTELPEIVEQEDRYLVVEYKRNDGSAKDWYFYTWNSGFGSNVFVPFENIDGTWTAKIPVKPGLETISWCIERAPAGEDGEPVHWTEKDGNDYTCAMPTDQTVVKIVMEEGKGIVKTYPYNTGYELAPKDKMIHFYYRNNDAFLEGKTDKYYSVAIEINGTECPMTFDKENERYTYDLEDLKPGTYQYRYVLQETEGGEKTYELDRYNEKKVTENEIEYSVVEYGNFAPIVTAYVYRDSMDYNDNNVLIVDIDAEKDADIEGMEIAEAYADLTALGGSSKVEIVPELMELTIAVKRGISSGEKSIPVTIYDQFNNEYTAEASVTVTDRNKGADFDWDEAIIYFAVTDRFFDGNSSNNNPGYDTSETGSSSYHGGDFAGLTQKLDYLKDLGVNTIWITPIVANDMEDGLVTDVAGVKSWGYHGYWASDFESLDSHLGTEQEFATLLDEAHARGMKIMVDVVLNHSGYDQEDKFNSILKDENGNAIPMIRTSKETVTGSDQQASLSGLPDFLTENAEVRNLLVEWQSNWISKYPIDYYRVDTVKHVDSTTWSAFKNALTKINPEFKMIGEWAGGGYATDTGMLRTGRMDSLLDFDFNGEATNFVTGSISSVEDFLTKRNASIDNTATLGQFIGSHDEDGFAYNLVNEQKLTAEKAAELTKVAASLQITAKGQPVIYYGEEIGLTGANNYPYQTNRYDFDWTKVTDDNASLTHYKKLLAIRNRYSEVLSKGARQTVAALDKEGIDVFKRVYNGASITVALNITDSEKTYTLEGLKKEAAYTDCYSGTKYAADADGKLTITIPAAANGGTAVLVEGEDLEGEDYEGKFRVIDIADQTYTGSAIKLSADQLKVYYGLTELKVGTDYTVKYVGDTKNVGTVTVKITGKGNYAGNPETVTFNIVPKAIDDEAAVVFDYQAYLLQSNKVQKPLTKITYNGKKLGNKDYTVEYYKLAADGTREGDALAGVKEIGKYEMVVTGTKNYDGVRTEVIEVLAEGTLMSKAKVTLDKTSYVCDGEEHKPTPTVKIGKNVVDAENYTVTYDADVTSAGTKTVTITGKTDKGYFGSITKTYKITAQKLSSVAKVDETTWQSSRDIDIRTRKAVQPSAKLVLKSDANTSLVLGKDYTVSYLKNDKPGTASMVFTGIGKYTGTVKKTFKINKIALSDGEASKFVYTVAETAPYGKKGAKAVVSVSYDGVKLTEGKDFKLSFSGNKKVGDTATVKIAGTGTFSGNVSRTFKVEQAAFADVTMTASDVVFVNKAGKFMSAPVITDASGAKLTNNKDYTLKYYLVNADGTETEKTKADIVELVKTEVNGEVVVSPATIKVVATAANANYKAENNAQSTYYNVVQSSIAKAKVTAKAKVYTGRAIALDENDLTVTIGSGSSKTTLTYGKDFEIVAGSYVNNVKKGTASVTIKGTGNYCGTKKVTFKITSRTMAWWWNLGK